MYLFVALYGVLLAATVLAYLGLIPHALKAIPYYDSIGHFILFGTLALVLDRVFGKKDVRLLGLRLPLALVSVALYAVGDEALQGLSSARTVDWRDLAAGLFGALLLSWLGRRNCVLK
jgi:VanZ family protein